MKTCFRNKIFHILAEAGLLVSLFAPNLAWAQTPLVNPTGSSSDTLQQIITKGDGAIAQRNTSLNSIITIVNGLTRISPSDKTNLIAQCNTDITSLNSLKAKLDADTDVNQARIDYQLAFGANRVYLLQLPRMHILIAADREFFIIELMNQIEPILAAKIQDQILLGNNPPANVTVAMTDLTSKLIDANRIAAFAVSAVSRLQPDNGNQQILRVNNVALTDARRFIGTAHFELQTGVIDIQTVWTWLNALGGNQTIPSLVPSL